MECDVKKAVVIALISFISCMGCEKQKSASFKPSINDDHKKPVFFATGWVDEDTYTVKATGTDENNAVENAQHQILKDIVDVRVRNDSMYRDIEKIRNEFSLPLHNGIILTKRPVPEGLQIYYRIYDKGLKKKFERK
jgi:maltose-binding protein MalE